MADMEAFPCLNDASLRDGIFTLSFDGRMEENVLDERDDDPESLRRLCHGIGDGLDQGCISGSSIVGSTAGRLCIRRRDKALSDCCDRTLVFRGREKFTLSTVIMVPSEGVGVVPLLWLGESSRERIIEAGDEGTKCSSCRRRGNLRRSGSGSGLGPGPSSSSGSG